MMSSKVSRRQFVSSACVVGVFALVGREVLYGQTKAVDEFVEQCDEEYGEGNWTMVSANASERDSWFIGDQYVCVDDDSERANLGGTSE